MRLVIRLAASLLLAAGCSSNSSAPDAATDLAIDARVDVIPTEPPVTKKNVGEPCAADADCVSVICFDKVCRKTCSNGPDCKSTEDCASDGASHPTFCYARAYSADIGTSCAVTGTCPGSGMKCMGGGADAATAYCSAECKDNMDCPPTLYCREFDDSTSSTGKRNYCARRGFCGRCQVDSQCESGGKCVKQGAESFCTVPCHQGSTECPRVADCKDVGGGNFQCLHRSGSCVGDGKMCSPCTEDADCVKGATCVAYFFSEEWFCATPCPNKGESCEGTSKYQCEEMPLNSGQTTDLCFPYNKDPTKEVSCTTLTPMMGVGDIMPDFAMVGYADENQSGSLNDERIAGKLKVTRLSDFTSSKIILFNVSAGWCQPCQYETTGFAGLMKKYRGDGLMIFQVLFDGAPNPGDDPTKALLDKWLQATITVSGAEPPQQPLNPQGACGIDPNRVVEPFNSGTGTDSGSTPLNMIVDAKTRKVLAKWNGTEPPGTATTEDTIRKYLGLLAQDAGPPPAKDAGVKDAAVKTE